MQPLELARHNQTKAFVAAQFERNCRVGPKIGLAIAQERARCRIDTGAGIQHGEERRIAIKRAT